MWEQRYNRFSQIVQKVIQGIMIITIEAPVKYCESDVADIIKYRNCAACPITIVQPGGTEPGK